MRCLYVLMLFMFGCGSGVVELDLSPASFRGGAMVSAPIRAVAPAASILFMTIPVAVGSIVQRVSPTHYSTGFSVSELSLIRTSATGIDVIEFEISAGANGRQVIDMPVTQDAWQAGESLTLTITTTSGDPSWGVVQALYDPAMMALTSLTSLDQ